MKIHLFGASGSGTTTLGRALAQQTGWKHLDADDYYWKRTTPPFQQKIPLAERNARLTQDFHAYDSVIISGSLVSWGKPWENAFDLAVFLYVPPSIRMERLKSREVKRYGDRLATDKAIMAGSRAFLEWASRYDDGDFEGRSLTQHNQWMKRLPCPVLRIHGDTSIVERTDLVLNEIQRLPTTDKKPYKTTGL